MTIGKYIPDEHPEHRTYVPKSSTEERNYKVEYNSLTNIFEPKDQYARNIVNISVGGHDVLPEHIDRLGRLIEARGEHSIFVRRKLDGRFCSCYNSITKTKMRAYCLECYDTRIIGGYDLFVNKDRPDGKITVAKPFVNESLSIEEWGRDWTNENEYWTLPYVPLTQGDMARSYDFIINYNEDGTEFGRFYITATKPSRSIGNKVTYQKFATRLADKPTYDTLDEHSIIKRGDVIYEIQVNKLEKIYGGSLATTPEYKEAAK